MMKNFTQQTGFVVADSQKHKKRYFCLKDK